MKDNSPIHVLPNSENLIFAILTDFVPKEHPITFHSIHSFCEEVALYCEKNGILFYVFAVQPLLNKLSGYVFENHEWTTTKVPLPHIIHNRIHSRKKEQSKEFQQFINDLQTFGIPHFNDRFLNKWETHTILYEELHLRPYLPATELIISKQNFEAFLQKYDQVFIKPIHGSQGKRIIRITTIDSCYELDYTTFSSEIERHFSSFPLLFRALQTLITKGAFIIQQGITFVRSDQCGIDFRVLCHQNQTGSWVASSIVARVSHKDSFVANIARGGEICKPIEVLNKSFDLSTTKHIIKLLKELAIEISKIISDATSGYYGEFGIDLGVDENGHPWIIEVNTKPSKNFEPAVQQSHIRPSAMAIVHYAKYLYEKNSAFNVKE